METVFGNVTGEVVRRVAVSVSSRQRGAGSALRIRIYHASWSSILLRREESEDFRAAAAVNHCLPILQGIPIKGIAAAEHFAPPSVASLPHQQGFLPMTTTQPTTIRVLAFRDGEAWVAQCIEYDIAEQGASLEDAMDRLEVTVSAECQYTLNEHGEAFKSIAPAPEAFEKKFETLNISLPHSNMEYRIAA